MSDVTQILSAIDRGDEKAANKLLPLDYQELRAAGLDKTLKRTEWPVTSADHARPRDLLVTGRRHQATRMAGPRTFFAARPSSSFLWLHHQLGYGIVGSLASLGRSFAIPCRPRLTN